MDKQEKLGTLIKVWDAVLNVHDEILSTPNDDDIRYIDNVLYSVEQIIQNKYWEIKAR
jgi:hypothetical protein